MDKYKQWTESIKASYKSNPKIVLDNFKIRINFSDPQPAVLSIIHETGHALSFFHEAKNFLKSQHSNIEAVSVYFETPFSSSELKLLQLFQICNNITTEFNGNVNDFCTENDHIIALYNALKLSKKIETKELTVFEGMNKAMYGEIPPLTLGQLDELVDIL